MYKILVVNDCTQILSDEFDNQQCVDYVKVNNLEAILKQREYDLIYFTNNLITEKLKKQILCDYMIVPKALKKLSLNTQICTTFLNIQILNKLIMDNIRCIKFKDYYEELVIANIIKEKIIHNTNLKEIYNKMCNNETEKTNVIKAVKRVIVKHYAGDSLLRRCKYVFCQKRIQEKFFKSILHNIDNDIANMRELKD